MAIPSYPDLAIPIRTAIINNAAIMTNMPDYNGNDNVFSRRPIPVDAPSPQIVIGPDISNIDSGGLIDQHLFIKRDIAIYGTNDTAERYRLTEAVAFAVRNLFHRNKKAITVSGWNVVNIWTVGPTFAPVDTPDKDVARNVRLTIELIAASF